MAAARGLFARLYDGTWCACEPGAVPGGAPAAVWWPDEAASKEIAASDDPTAAALEICHTAPMRGEWRC